MPMNSVHNNLKLKVGFPHSEISGSLLVCQLPEAYCRLLRPSSPLTAKASTIRAYSLDYATLNDFTVATSITTLEYLKLAPLLFHRIVKELPASNKLYRAYHHTLDKT